MDSAFTPESKKLEGSTVRIQDRDYKISKLKSDSRAHSLLGRATRVYQAKDRDGKSVIIKDVWVDNSRKREHAIQEEIIEDLKRADLTTALSLFFTHRCHEDVMLEDRDTVDSTESMCLDRSRTPLDFSSCKAFRTTSPDLGHTQDFSTGSLTSHDNAVLKPSRGPHRAFKDIKHRVHYRLVIEEVAVPLIEVQDAGKYMFSLYALHARKFHSHSRENMLNVETVIFDLGTIRWVHRDLSVGNIYYYVDEDGEPGAKLGDFEYAKKMNEGSEAHDFRTVSLFEFLSFVSYSSLQGTRWFWSVEIESGEYSFQPKKETPSVTADTKIEDTPDKDTPDEDTAKRQSSKLGMLLDREVVTKSLPDVDAEESPSVIVFRHNPLHDLESIWWMVLFGICKREVLPSRTDHKWTPKYQIDQLDDIFPSIPVATNRRKFFESKSTVRQFLDTLDDRLADVHKHVRLMNVALINAYLLAEKGLPDGDGINRTAWVRDLESGSYSKLQDAFHLALKALAYNVKWPQFGLFLKRMSSTEAQEDIPKVLFNSKKRRTGSSRGGTRSGGVNPR